MRYSEREMYEMKGRKEKRGEENEATRNSEGMGERKIKGKGTR
jgi:hypothetical protein